MLDTNKIKLEVINLLNDTKCSEINDTLFKERMQTKYKYLYTNSSTLFDSCIKGDLNQQQLDYILTMIEKVNSGADYHKTSIEVGQQFVDVYVKPMLEKH